MDNDPAFQQMGARDLLRTGDGLFDARDFVCACIAEDNTNLQRLLIRALTPFRAQGIGDSIMVRQAASLLKLALQVNPLGRQETDFRA